MLSLLPVLLFLSSQLPNKSGESRIARKTLPASVNGLFDCPLQIGGLGMSLWDWSSPPDCPSTAARTGRAASGAGSSPSQNPECALGLKLGKRTYFKAASAAAAPPLPPQAAPTVLAGLKCQVEGCDDDLATAKDYHRKHRVCEIHSKCPRVIVAGQERRFCQQCSRFHALSEFDEKKRSCRRRLSDHNARRRKPHPDAFSFGSSGSPAAFSFPDNGRQISFVLNRSQCNQTTTMATPSWHGASNVKSSLMERTESGTSEQLHFSSSPMSSERHHQDMYAVLHTKGLGASVTSSNFGAPDVRRALSLLSSDSWSYPDPSSAAPPSIIRLNEESAQLQPQMHAPSAAYSHYMTGQLPVPQLPTLATHGNGGPFQEFQLIKPSYDSAFFGSSPIG